MEGGLLRAGSGRPSRQKSFSPPLELSEASKAPAVVEATPVAAPPADAPPEDDVEAEKARENERRVQVLSFVLSEQVAENNDMRQKVADLQNELHRLRTSAPVPATPAKPHGRGLLSGLWSGSAGHNGAAPPPSLDPSAAVVTDLLEKVRLLEQRNAALELENRLRAFPAELEAPPPSPRGGGAAKMPSSPRGGPTSATLASSLTRSGSNPSLNTLANSQPSSSSSSAASGFSLSTVSQPRGTARSASMASMQTPAGGNNMRDLLRGMSAPTQSSGMIKVEVEEPRTSDLLFEPPVAQPPNAVVEEAQSSQPHAARKGKKEKDYHSLYKSCKVRVRQMEGLMLSHEAKIEDLKQMLRKKEAQLRAAKQGFEREAEKRVALSDSIEEYEARLRKLDRSLNDALDREGERRASVEVERDMSRTSVRALRRRLRHAKKLAKKKQLDAILDLSDSEEEDEGSSTVENDDEDDDDNDVDRRASEDGDDEDDIGEENPGDAVAPMELSSSREAMDGLDPSEDVLLDPDADGDGEEP